MRRNGRKRGGKEKGGYEHTSAGIDAGLMSMREQ